jgi:hypothetical protein
MPVLGTGTTVLVFHDFSFPVKFIHLNMRKVTTRIDEPLNFHHMHWRLIIAVSEGILDVGSPVA